MLDRKPPRVDLTLSPERVLNIEVSGEWKTLLQAAGSVAVGEALIGQIARLGSEGRSTDPEASNFVLGFVDAMQPRDSAEVLLLTQMAATHQAVMMLAKHLNHTTTIQQKDCAERALNKTARTYAAQMESLKRYRFKGQQVVRVERVTVEAGAQAVVGNVAHRGRGADETRRQPHAKESTLPQFWSEQVWGFTCEFSRWHYVLLLSTLRQVMHRT